MVRGLRCHGRRLRIMTKHCIICGAPFQAPPSSKKVTCSPACRSVRAAKSAASSKRKWNDDAKQRRAADPSVKSKMAELQPAGTAAALSLPEGQRGPQNRASKIWILIDPSGNRIEVVNLLDWARKNYARFEPDCTDRQASSIRISAGFNCIASGMRGVKSHRRPANTYKGWGLADLPAGKGDDHNDK